MKLPHLGPRLLAFMVVAIPLQANVVASEPDRQSPQVHQIAVTNDCDGMNSTAVQPICAKRNGQIWLVADRGRVAITEPLQSGCEVGDGFVAGNPKKGLLLLPYDCRVEGGTLFVSWKPGGPQVRALLPYGLLRPVIQGDAVFVVSGAEVARVRWPSMEWLWRVRVEAPNGEGALRPSEFRLERGCLVLTESKYAAAQFGRPPLIVRLDLRNGDRCSNEENAPVIILHVESPNR